VTIVATGAVIAVAVMAFLQGGLVASGAAEASPGTRVPMTRVTAAPSVSQLAGGGYAAYALSKDGSVWAWGDDLEGQLGNGSDGTATDVPVRALRLSDAAAVAAGANSAFALRGDGTVWAWGDDSEGELGNGKETFTSEVPVRVDGLRGVKQIAAGDFAAYAVTRRGAVWAWGANGAGQLGRKLAVATSDTPVEVSGLSAVEALAAGAGTAYALRRGGTVWAWGDNGFGELGRGHGLTGSEVPVKIAGIRGATAVAAAADAGFALMRDGTVRAWGDGSFGDLGSGTCRTRHPTNCLGSSRPKPVRHVTQARAIAAGTYAAYALAADGSVWAWGYGAYGQLGDGSTDSSDVAVQVNRLHHVIAIAAGGNAAYALEANGSVWAWGYGAYGQLGDGGTGSTDVPVEVRGLE
jgi:alpha-tubulin suppressor-like RCC1 family protein